MPAPPRACRLEVRPRQRFELVPLAQRLPPELTRAPRLLVASLHTTAGLVAPDVARRCGDDAEAVKAWLQPVHRLFPRGASYRHDLLHLRDELSEEQRRHEPLNGDAHLTFIGAGLQGCVILEDPARTPPWLVELDGVHEEEHRCRQVVAVAHDSERCVAREVVEVPVAATVDAVDLRRPELGAWPVIERLLREHDVATGRVELRLASGERHAGLTVNEHETLLMRHDLATVLRDPWHFALERGRHVARDPRSLRWKGLDYARHDGMKLLGRLESALGSGGALAVRLAEALLGPAAGRLLRVQSSLSLPACRELSGTEDSPLVQGRYQSPLLVQWRRPKSGRRRLLVTVHRFD